jgi:hypothetical protein
MQNIAIRRCAGTDGWETLPGGECMGKMEGLDAARAKCSDRYSWRSYFG